jgi:hypothetical protein
MRFMVIVKGSDQDGPPSSELIAEMGKYNEELMKAGVLMTGEGLLPSSKGAMVSFSKNGTKVTDGPFTEAKELIGGFWILNVKSKEEALEWVRKIPFEEGDVEVRQIAEVTDYPRDEISAEALDKEQAWREDEWKPKA